MLFSIIISTFNRPTLLKSCLLSVELAIRNASHISIEVIVTDDSISDDSMELVVHFFPNYYYVRGPRKGPAANRNNGASKAKGEWLVFFDDDVIVNSNILRKYAELTNSSHVEVFEGAIHPSDFKMMKKDMSECPVNINGNCFWSANFCIKSNLFRQVNGFDERFTIAAQEDQDLYIRLQKNASINFAQDAIVIHPVRIASLSKKLRGIFAGVDNWYLLETKHHKQSIKRVLQVSLHLVYAHIRGTLLNIRDLKIKSAFFSFFWLLNGLPYFLLLSIKDYYTKKTVYE